MGVLWHCPDGIFEVVLAGRWRRGREGRGGTMPFAWCGHPGRCWPSGRGRQTMTRRDYSVAVLFQHAAWTTIEFRKLRVTVTIASLFLKCAIHLTLPPVAMAVIAHAFKEYCGGGGGGSADFAALAALYAFDFHLGMGVWLVGLAPLWFGAWGGWRGGVTWGRGRDGNDGGGAD